MCDLSIWSHRQRGSLYTTLNVVLLEHSRRAYQVLGTYSARHTACMPPPTNQWFNLVIIG